MLFRPAAPHRKRPLTIGDPVSAYRYCPYDLTSDPSDLGLVDSDVLTTDFGRLHLVVSGKPTGPAVTVLLHGVGGSWASWSAVLQSARNRGVDLGDLLIFDLPGFGQSTHAQEDLDADRVGAMVAQVVFRLGWSEMNLVGHSMGGFLALNMAGNGLPGLVSVRALSGAYLSIVAAAKDPRAALRDHRDAAISYFGLKALSSLGPVGPALAKGAYHVGLLPLFLGNTTAHPWKLRRSIQRGMANSVNPRSFLLAAQNGQSYEPTERWAGISIPVQATFGRSDKLVPPSDGEVFAHIVPRADVRVIDDAGHFAQTEQPDAVVDLMVSPIR